jgi:hypothetical protein
MPTVQLDEEEWQKVMAIIAAAPWNIANPLLMKIGEQLRQVASNNAKMPLPDVVVDRSH